MAQTWTKASRYSSERDIEAKKEPLMKFNIEVDCTPEEVRRLVGLPDLSEVHTVYLERVKAVAEKGITPDLVEGMVRNWVPMGGAGVDMVKDLIGAFAGGTSAASSKGKKG
jgi:hypothetical protein